MSTPIPHESIRRVNDGGSIITTGSVASLKGFSWFRCVFGEQRGIALIRPHVALYPAELRNFLMHLALTGLFRAKWSAAVHEEWIADLLKNRPDLTRERLERTRQLMDKAALDALVEGYEDLIPSLSLPDENDRHVLAGAIRGEAQVIVTMNLKVFPDEFLQHYEIEAQHPDEFILQLIKSAPDVVMNAAETHRRSLKNPPKSIEEFLASLEAQGLPKSVAALLTLFQRATDIER